MATGYEVKMYSDIARIATSLERLERMNLERTLLIAALIPTVLPLDIGLHHRLQIAAEAVDEFLKGK